MKLIPSLLLAGALLVPTVAMASPRLNVPSSAAKGYRSAIPVIPLTPSRGVNVDFSQIEEKVYQVLSDNKALLHVEAAPPLEQGASLVHLTALRDTGNTSITFITLDKSGETNHYVFEVKLGSPGPYFIAITPDAEPRFSPTPAALTTKAFTQHQEGINAVQAGMRVAVGQGLLTRGSSLWQALEKFIAQVNQGVHPSEAARSVGIKQSVLSRLIQMGQGSLEKFPAPSVPTPEEQEMAVLPPPPTAPASKKKQFSPKKKTTPIPDKKVEIEVQPPPTSKPQTLTKTESIPSQKAAVKVEKKAKGRKITTHDQANAIARGLLKAHDENIVRFRSNTYWKTQDVIYLLRKGHNRQYAAKRARVPQALIEKLLTLGGLPPAQSQVSVK